MSLQTPVSFSPFSGYVLPFGVCPGHPDTRHFTNATSFSLFGNSVRAFNIRVILKLRHIFPSRLFSLRLSPACLLFRSSKNIVCHDSAPFPHVNRSLVLRLSSFCDSGASAREKTWSFLQTMGGLLTSQLDGYCGPNHPLTNLDQFKDKTGIKSIRRQTVVNKV